MAHLPELEVYAKTVYAEARGEPEEGQIWVAWVIKNRARMNRDYWGRNRVKDVCLCPGQFECWNNRNDIEIREPQIYQRIRQLTREIYGAPHGSDPTRGSDHYHNPAKEGRPDWVNNCVFVRTIRNHDFYRDR